MIKLHWSLTLLSICIAFGLSAQCHTDRHNTSNGAAWISCAPSSNPNSVRGNSHWIQYDFDELKALNQLHIWNLNNPDQLDNGAKQVVIDYSDDGISWTEWGSFELDRADASGTYEGLQGPDLDGLQTKHLLLTIIENHGGNCAGFAEIRINTSEPLSVDKISEPSFSLFPNPAVDYTLLSIQSDSPETGQLLIHNAIGQQVYQQSISLSGGQQTIRVDFGELISGQYFLRLVTDKRDASTDLSITK